MKVSVEVPIVAERFPAVIRDALATRRQASLTGVCPGCSGRLTVGGLGLVLDHARGCEATDGAITIMFEREGIDLRELDFEMVTVEVVADED